MRRKKLAEQGSRGYKKICLAVGPVSKKKNSPLADFYVAQALSLLSPLPRCAYALRVARFHAWFRRVSFAFGGTRTKRSFIFSLPTPSLPYDPPLPLFLSLPHLAIPTSAHSQAIEPPPLYSARSQLSSGTVWSAETDSNFRVAENNLLLSLAATYVPVSPLRKEKPSRAHFS